MTDASKPESIVTIDMSPKKAPIGIKKYIKLVKKSLQSSPYYYKVYLITPCHI